MNKISIGKHINHLRNLKGYTLVQLAELSGVSNPYISQIENDKFTPSPEILKKLADPLGVSYIDLMEKAGYWDEKEATYRKKVYEESKENLEVLNAFQKEWNFENFKMLHYMKLEEVLAPNNTNVYLDGALLNEEDKTLLINVARVIFGNKPKNYPTEKELKERYQQIKKLE